MKLVMFMPVKQKQNHKHEACRTRHQNTTQKLQEMYEKLYKIQLEKQNTADRNMIAAQVYRWQKHGRAGGSSSTHTINNYLLDMSTFN